MLLVLLQWPGLGTERHKMFDTQHQKMMMDDG